MATVWRKLTERIRVGGLKGLVVWVWQWLYWRTGLYRLVRPTRAATAPPASHPLPTPICLDLRAWAENNPAAGYQEVSPARHIARTPPLTVEAKVDQNFIQFYEVDVPAKVLVRVDGARVTDPGGLVLLPDGRFVAEVAARDAAAGAGLLQMQPGYKQAASRPAIRKPGRYYLLTVIWWDNYYHWHHDVLARLHRVLEHLPADTQFIVPEPLREYQRAALGVLSIPAGRLAPFDGQSVWQVDSLYFSVPYWTKLFDVPEAIHHYRQSAWQLAGVTQAAPRRRLFISRQSADHDRPANEAEIIACVQDYGFEINRPEELSVMEQIQLFSQAELIVGNGAGLTNAWFAGSDAAILEFQRSNHVFTGFYSIARALGQDYHYLIGTPLPNRQSQYEDLEVPIDKLRRSLDQMAARTKRR